ncbi:hypothetical protein BD310DRAFT_911031 [Dichomitus squalens]|uniref:Uncharacterized protein n=1 Tax=Dichomitus squalens TaxID=114155 RepID=A0A4V2K9V3_9APHY|nr:hypothetical protein BD310DRAFT_911031 [Dichomitus squalens]
MYKSILTFLHPKRNASRPMRTRSGSKQVKRRALRLTLAWRSAWRVSRLRPRSLSRTSTAGREHCLGLGALLCSLGILFYCMFV